MSQIKMFGHSAVIESLIISSLKQNSVSTDGMNVYDQTTCTLAVFLEKWN